MTTEELFAQLKDIHVPLAPGWWPLAPGWWLLLVVTVLAIAGIWYYFRRRKIMRPLRGASAELERIQNAFSQSGNTCELAQQLSGWLKRVALYAFPETPVGGLTGDAWLDFLDRTGGSNVFTKGQGRVFGRAVYEPRPQIDPDTACSLCQKWLEAIRPKMLERGRVNA